MGDRFGAGGESSRRSFRFNHLLWNFRESLYLFDLKEEEIVDHFCENKKGPEFL
ncbi:hypothetical protein AAHH67_27100 [Niallia circulans]